MSFYYPLFKINDFSETYAYVHQGIVDFETFVPHFSTMNDLLGISFWPFFLLEKNCCEYAYKSYKLICKFNYFLLRCFFLFEMFWKKILKFSTKFFFFFLNLQVHWTDVRLLFIYAKIKTFINNFIIMEKLILFLRSKMKKDVTLFIEYCVCLIWLFITLKDLNILLLLL